VSERCRARTAKSCFRARKSVHLDGMFSAIHHPRSLDSDSRAATSRRSRRPPGDEWNRGMKGARVGGNARRDKSAERWRRATFRARERASITRGLSSRLLIRYFVRPRSPSCPFPRASVNEIKARRPLNVNQITRLYRCRARGCDRSTAQRTTEKLL